MPDAPDTIVFIHGLWMTPRSWESYIPHLEARGYTVLAPAWPGLEVEVESLRRDPSPIAALDIGTILDHYEGVIRALDRPPVIMGHSFGGAFTQVLLDRGLGAAGVGLASATVKGVPDLPLSTLRATFPVLSNPFNKGKAVPQSAKQFHYAFANTLSRADSDELHERYGVPAAATVLFEGALANVQPHAATKVDFGRSDRAPLLLLSFGEDHIIPPKAARHNAEKYAKSSATVDYQDFPGRPHFPGVPGWEAVADHALDWIERVTASPSASS